LQERSSRPPGTGESARARPARPQMSAYRSRLILRARADRFDPTHNLARGQSGGECIARMDGARIAQEAAIRPVGQAVAAGQDVERAERAQFAGDGREALAMPRD